MVHKVKKAKSAPAPSTSDEATRKKTKSTKSEKKIANGFHENTENASEVVTGDSSSEAQDINQKEAMQKGRKRKQVEEKKAVPQTKAKKQKVLLEVPKISSVSGKVFVVGENDVGQLGLGDDVTEKKKPTLLELPSSIVDIAAGGMHSVCLTERGEVITFGCNDEGALGRITSEEGSEMRPEKIDIPERIVQVSAGDSHSAALSESGQVYVWGNFRNGNGPMGLVNDGVKQPLPVRILNDVTVVKISSGSDHLVCLSQEGIIYTCGCGDVGQLGRFTERAVEYGKRNGTTMLLPEKVPLGRSNKVDRVDNVWTGSYATFVKVQDSGAIYVFGLNNFSQLGIHSENYEKIFKPVKSMSFNGKQWSQISGGQHHTLSLDNNGQVHSLGRSEYGRLGLGDISEDVLEPTVIPVLADTKSIDISSGNLISLAVAENGSVYSWGMGSNYQLGHGTEDDQHSPKLIEGTFFKSWKAFKVSGGGQHTLILANPREKAEESQ